MQIELRDLLRRQGITSIFVTHDQDEALVMSDRIAVMNAGRIEHFASPVDIYRHPQTLFTMEFVGQSTRLAGRVKGREGEHIVIDTAAGQVRARGAHAEGSAVIVGVRPELIDITGVASPEVNTLALDLADAVYLGSKTVLYLAPPAEGDRVLIEVPRLIEAAPRGTATHIGWPVEETMVFPCP